MEKKNFECSISVNIRADEVISKISVVREWWGINFEGNARRQGDNFVVKMGGESFFDFTVQELIPAKRVVWLVKDCNMPWYTDKKEWANTRLIFDVRANEAGSDLTFTHEGLTPDVECYKECEPGWTHWIKTSLFSYLTTGTGVFREPTK